MFGSGVVTKLPSPAVTSGTSSMPRRRSRSKRVKSSCSSNSCPHNPLLIAAGFDKTESVDPMARIIEAADDLGSPLGRDVRLIATGPVSTPLSEPPKSASGGQW